MLVSRLRGFLSNTKQFCTIANLICIWLHIHSYIHTFIHYTHMIMLCCIKEYIVVLKNNLFGFSTIAYQGSRPIFLCEIIVEICFQSKLLFLLLSYFNFLINSRPILQCTLFVLARSWHSLYRPKYRPTFMFYVKLMLC